MEERIIFLVGGFCAERRFAEDDDRAGCRLDLERARELTDAAGVARAVSRAEEIIRSRWEQVEMIAAALLTRGTLSGDAIERIVAGRGSFREVA